MSNWLPFHIHTIYSLLDGLIQPKKLAKKIKEFGYQYCTITDHGNVSGAVNFSSAMLKEGVIPVLGNEFYTFETDGKRDMDHTVVLAKNLQGWKKLLKLTTLSNKQFYYKPRVKLEQIADLYDKDLLVFSGHPGSIVGESQDKEKDAARFKEYFGDDFYLEIQRFYPGNNGQEIADLGKKLNIRSVACADCHYIEKKDAEIHRVALCSNLGKKLPEIKRMLLNNEDVPMSGFFTEDSFYVPSLDNLKSFGHTDEEIDCSDILSKIEKYSILNKPVTPKFDTGDKSEIEFIKELCRQGWVKKYKPTWNKEVYKNRVLEELEIIEEFNLAGYLLIVWDYINFAKSKKILVGPGRGSSAGSLVCYLIGITEIDPIPSNLIFERFINVSRFYSDHINFQEFNYLENYKNVGKH